MLLVTLRIVRGLFSDVVLIDRFLRTFVSFSVFSVFRTVVLFVRLSICPGDFMVFRCCFMVWIY